MSDMYFKSLPDKSTPLIPSNLDKLNDIKVSLTQPTTNEKVWIQKGKNLFNPKRDIELIGQVRDKGNGVINEAEVFYGLKIKVKPNTTYVTSSDVPYSEWSNLCFFDGNMSFISGSSYNEENKVFTTPSNCSYVTIALLKTYNWFQLEQGSTATEYEAYVEKKILCKNDNGVYEEFYNESEFATNEKLNGNVINFDDWQQAQTIEGAGITAIVEGMNATIETRGRGLLVTFTLPIRKSGGTCWIDIVVDGAIVKKYACSINENILSYTEVFNNISKGKHNVYILIESNNVSSVEIFNYTSKSFTVAEI